MVHTWLWGQITLVLITNIAPICSDGTARPHPARLYRMKYRLQAVWRWEKWDLWC
jgi:hypothetical protein